MLYITSYCSRHRAIQEAVKELVSYGFINIELTGGTDYESYSEEELQRLKAEHGLVYLLHNYFPPQSEELVINLASENGKIRTGTLKLIKEAIQLSRVFGQNLYGLHAGYARDLIPVVGNNGLFIAGDDVNNSATAFYANLAKISTEVLQDGFRMAVENAFPDYDRAPFSMLSNPADLHVFLNFCGDHPNIGLLLDLGHLNVAAHYSGFNKELFLEELLACWPERIFEIHLSANNGAFDSHDAPTAHSFEVLSARRVLDVTGDIPVVMECHQPPSIDLFRRYETLMAVLEA